MVRIKILEDDPADRDTLIECLRKYEREQGQSFSITAYDNPSDFMDNYHMDADLIFMDIELPGINGIETSHQLRAGFCHQAHQLLPLFFHDAPRAAQPACAG